MSAEERQPTMTTQERMLVEAREWWQSVKDSVGDPCFSTNRNVEIPSMLAEFALSQLRAAKESGHLRCKDECKAKQMKDWINTGHYECSCGFAERFGDL